VRRSLVALLLVGFGTAGAGCGKSATPEPAAPVHQDTQTRAPRRHERPLPRLIAPPPAYGNRVVMARAQSNAVAN
jgi:hypothetical protein